MNLILKVKFGKEVEEIVIADVKFYSFERNFIAVHRNNGKKIYIKTGALYQLKEE